MPQVLICDDAAIIASTVSTFLQAHNIDSIITSNGQECFDVLKVRDDIPLAIVDINMPVLDGLSMIEKVRNELPDCKTHFIMLTTDFDRKSKSRGRDLGVKGWIIKPFRGEIVIETIKKYLA